MFDTSAAFSWLLRDADERNQHQGHSDETDEGQPPGEVEDRADREEDGERKADRVGEVRRCDLLKPPDVSHHPRHQKSGRVPGEEARRLAQHLFE
jgi:hypothetical protein